MERGETVITDRYVPSGLVMQRFDGIGPAFLWQLNSEADRPDLAVILEAAPEIIAERPVGSMLSVRCRYQACLVSGDDELYPVPGVQLGQ